MTTIDSMDTMERRTDELGIGQRLGALLAAAGTLVVIGFFTQHLSQSTGFFAEKFGTLEMFLLFAPLLFSLIDAIVQIITGYRRLARLFEALSGLLLGVGALWFLIHFPFDFAHLPDVLPDGLRFLLAWITNDIAKIVLVIQLIAGPLTALVAVWKFFTGAR